MLDLFDKNRGTLASDTRPVLIAMNNPVSPYNKDHVLYPHPEGCAGHRLWRMLDEAAMATCTGPIQQITRREYLERFDRRNLLYTREWSAADARRAAHELLPTLRGRVAAILGAATRKALGFEETPWGEWRRISMIDLQYVVLPHPSGRCREYNDPAMRRLTGEILLDMYRGVSQ